MLLAFFIMFGVGSLVFLAYACELDDAVKELILRGKTNSLKTPKILQPHLRRIKQMEKDGRQAVEALKNLHETKKKLNKDFQDDWDNQYRLLLPPPPTPKREAVRWKPYYGHEPMTLYPTPSSSIRNKSFEFSPSVRPVPVGVIKRLGEYWYGFNNLPGYPHQMMFNRVRCFHDVDTDKFWAFMPTIKETADGEFVWEESKAKTLATNVFEEIRDRLTS